MKKKKTAGKNRRCWRLRLIRRFFLTVIFFVGIFFSGFYMGARSAGEKQAGANPSAVSAFQQQAPEQEASDTSDKEASLPAEQEASDTSDKEASPPAEQEASDTSDKEASPPAEQEASDTSDTEASLPTKQDNSKDELLVLVNPWNPLPEDYQVSLQQLDNGLSVDVRCYSDLQEMMEACRNAGLNPVICSAYRTRKKQESLYQNKVERLVSQGYSRDDAIACAGKVVAVPGTSEHQLGLALDIVDSANQNLDESQENTAVQKWLMENSWKYGFILRYPNEKSNITGIIYEPWHYRYVGKTAAKEIFQSGLCLEEWLGYGS